MLKRINAEFEMPELAESALGKLREQVQGVFSTNMMYNRTSDKAEKLRHGTLYTIIPTAVTAHNYMTAVIESPASQDVIPEPERNRKTSVYVICENSSVKAVNAVLSSAGGMNIHVQD